MLRRMLECRGKEEAAARKSLCGSGVSRSRPGLFRPHYVTWSEQQRSNSMHRLPGNVIRIITETGLRVYKELTPMRKEQIDLANAVVWIPDSKTPNGVAEVPLTDLAVEGIPGSD